MQRKIDSKFLCIVSVLLLLFFAVFYCKMCSATEVPPMKQHVQIPIAQYNQLKQNQALLEMNLQLASDTCKMLTLPSQELISSLIAAKKQLAISRQELKNCKASLTNAKESITKTEELYNKLMEQLELERKEADKAKKAAYRKGWLKGFCIGAASSLILCAIK